MNNSIAIWTDNKPQESHLHVNYWIIKQRFKFRDHFLDIGIKLKNCNGGKISFYFPLFLKKSNISELGHELQSRELSNALFNENCTIIQGGTIQKKQIQIQLPSNKLTVFTFDKENDVDISNKYNGSIITINMPNNRKDWYIRFRIKCNNYDVIKNIFSTKNHNTIRSIFSKNHTPKGSFYQSVRNSIDAIDFRLNDKRTLDPSLHDDKGSSLINFNKLHFFLISDHEEDLTLSSTRPKKTRLLEHDVWKEYLKNISGNKRKYCANQWTCEPDDAWEIFLKIRFCNSNYMTIGIYLLFAFLFAGMVNIASAWTYEEYGNVLETKIKTLLNSEESATQDDNKEKPKVIISE